MGNKQKRARRRLRHLKIKRRPVEQRNTARDFNELPLTHNNSGGRNTPDAPLQFVGEVDSPIIAFSGAAESLQSGPEAESTRLEIDLSNYRLMSSQLGDPGSGAGKRGGGGGSIREVDGGMGKHQAAQEDEFFYKLQREQLSELKAHLSDEITFYEEQLKRHNDAINRIKERVAAINKK